MGEAMRSVSMRIGAPTNDTQEINAKCAHGPVSLYHSNARSLALYWLVMGRPCNHQVQCLLRYAGEIEELLYIDNRCFCLL